MSGLPFPSSGVYLTLNVAVPLLEDAAERCQPAPASHVVGDNGGASGKAPPFELARAAFSS